MPPKATQKDADGVAFMLAALGSLDDPIARIRLRKISAEDWRVEMKFDSRWAKTPNVGPRGNMVAALCDLLRQRQATTK